MKLQDYAEDVSKHESGSPFYLEDGCFYVKRVGTIEFYKQIESIKAELYGFAPKDVDHNLVTAHWLAQFGVTGWDGVLDGDDEIKFSVKNALSIFLNPAYYMSLNPILINHGKDYNNYLSDEVSEDIEAAKKS